MTTVLNPPAPTTTPVVVESAEHRSTIGYIALGLALVGFALAVLAVTAGLAWLLLLPAIILGAIGLFLPHRTKAAALAAVVIGIIGLILSMVGLRLPADLVGTTTPLNNSGGFSTGLFGGTTASGTTAGADGSSGTSSTTDTSGSTTPIVGAEVAVGGTTVTAAVNGVDCGLPLIGVDGLTVTTDVLCAVHVSVLNDSGAPVQVSSSNLTVSSNGTPLTIDANVGDAINAQVAVGQATDGLVYVRVPAGTTNLAGLDVRVN